MSKLFVFEKSSFFQRVMPSGFFILLTYFLRVDGVLIRMNGTRFHYETGNDYMLKEFTTREAKFETIKHVSIIYFLSNSTVVLTIVITNSLASTPFPI